MTAAKSIVALEMDDERAVSAQEAAGKSEPSVFPLFPSHNNTSTVDNNCQDLASQWLSNSSFQITDFSAINDAISSLPNPEEKDESPEHKPSSSYELLPDESSEETGQKKKRKKSKRKRSRDTGDNYNSFISSKSKDYFFDSHGDRDNLVYGKVYR